MNHIRFYTAGESHGQKLTGILDGLPANIPISIEEINHQLWRRQQGYGRGRRMKIESDTVTVLSGIRFGKTLGSPISIEIENKDWKNWQQKMAVEGEGKKIKKVTVPRPGHVDLAGALKYRQEDIRNVLERASARETAMRVALGSLARQFLEPLGILIASHVIQLHDVKSRFSFVDNYPNILETFPPEDINSQADASPVRCLDEAAEKAMMERIDLAKAKRDTVGGIFEVIAFHVPVGLGSHVHWDRRLDTRIAAAMMSIQAIKGVEIGSGFGGAIRRGSEVHDEIFYDAEQEHYYRKSNRAGGVEGGISNGMPIVVRAAMKPISTLMRPLHSVDISSKQATEAHIERSDVCALPAAGIVGEAMLALVIADALLEKIGGDSLEEVLERFQAWEKRGASRRNG